MSIPDVVLGSLDLSGTEGGGVRWTTERVDGWDGSPASTLSLTQKPRAIGAWAGEAFGTARHLVIVGSVSAPTEDALTDAMDRLNASCSLDDTSLTVGKGTSSRTVTVRRSDDVIPTMGSTLDADWSIQLVAPDPRKYGTALTGTTGLPATTGGVLIPATFPITITETITSGQVSVTNLGNADAPVTLTLTGPTIGSLVGPIITHYPSGRRLVFPADKYVPAGESWVIDCTNRQVLAGGTEPRTGWLSERGWPVLVPGVNVFGLTAIGSGPSPSLSVSSWSAWQ